MSEDELAFYDALETNDSAVRVLGEPTLRDDRPRAGRDLRKNVTIDWTLRENVRAQMRVLVRRILRKYGYPPDKQGKATQTGLGASGAVLGSLGDRHLITPRSYPSPTQQPMAAAAPRPFGAEAGCGHDEAGLVDAGKRRNLGMIETGGAGRFGGCAQKCGESRLVGVELGEECFERRRAHRAAFRPGASAARARSSCSSSRAMGGKRPSRSMITVSGCGAREPSARNSSNTAGGTSCR